MKKVTAIILSAIMLLMCAPVFAAQMAQRSSVRAFIDYTPIDSYVIDGYTYIDAEELGNYGFEVAYDEGTKRLNVSRIKFATPMYTRELWEKSTAMQTGAEIGESDIDVYLDGERTDSYFVDGKILIMIDTLCKYGSFYWDEELKQVSITIFRDELGHEFENAEDKVELINDYEKYIGQVNENNVPNGIGKLERGEVNYLGYFKDGKPDGYIYKNTYHTESRSYTYRYINFIGKIDGSKESGREYIVNEDGVAKDLKREENFGVSILPAMEIPTWTGVELYPDKDVYTEGCYYEYWYGKTSKHEYRIWHDGKDLQTVSDMEFASWMGISEADLRAYMNGRFVSVSGFFEYIGGREVFAKRHVQTISEGNPVILNDSADGAEEVTFKPSVWIYGRNIYFDVDPVIQDGRVLVPIRNIAYKLNAEVVWDEEARSVRLIKDDKTISMQIGNNEIKVGDETITIDVPPQIVDDRTLVPLRAVSEGFGAEVVWNEHSKRVTITD